MTYSLQAEYDRELIKLKRQLSTEGKVDEDVIEKIKEVVKVDEEHNLPTDTMGEFSDYDFFFSYFGEKIPVSELNEEIFPSRMEKPKKPKNIKPIIDGNALNPDSLQPQYNGYDEGLSANNRLKFLTENFPIVSGSKGDGSFKGAILFEVEGSDLVIVENFWRQTRDGKIVEDYGKATYILPKDQAMDLIKLSRGEIVAKKDPRIVTVRHGSKEYYNNLVERFNEAQNAELERIEQVSNPLENAKTRKNKIANKEEKQDENQDENQDIENDEGIIENPEIETEETVVENPKEENTIDANSQEIQTKKTNDFTEENREFLSNINENIGGILTPEIMEGLLKRASYSFKDLYNRKLKDKINSRLEILEIPEEELDKESQKVFVYIRIAKNMSMIKTSMIAGEKLEELLDYSILEYQNGYSFLEKHIGDGLTYNELRRYMKEYIDTGIDPLDKQNETNSEMPKEELPAEEKTETIDEVNGEGKDNEEQDKVLNFATKYIELLEKLKQVEAESERLSIELIEKEQEALQRKEELDKAKEEEERARKALEEATANNEKTNDEIEKIKAEKERIEKEKQELQEKKNMIDDILK